MKRLTLLLLLALTLISCRFAPRGASPLPSTPQTAKPSPTISSPASSPTPQSLDPVFDIRYSEETATDPRRLSLDIFPTSQPNAPVMIFVHGGGWRRGNKSNVDTKPNAFNQNRFVFISINYRLIPEVDIAEQVGDVAAAIAWVKNNITGYGGDPNRIFLMGHSAGAHLVSLVATDPSYLETNGMTLADIHGVVSLDTQAYDINILLENAPERTNHTYRSVFGDEPEMWKKFSPINYIQSGKNIPSFLLVFTGVNPEHAQLTELFAIALKKSSISATVQPATEQSHDDVNSEFGQPDDAVTDAAFVWLMEILAGL